MKKLLTLITSLFILINLTSCGVKEVKDVEIIPLNTKDETATVTAVKDGFYVTTLGIIYKNELDQTYEVKDKIELTNYTIAPYEMEIIDDKGRVLGKKILENINNSFIRKPTKDSLFTKSNLETNIVFQFRTNIGDFYKDHSDNYYLTTHTFFDGSKNTIISLNKEYKKPTNFTTIEGYKIEYVDATDAIIAEIKE